MCANGTHAQPRMGFPLAYFLLRVVSVRNGTGFGRFAGHLLSIFIRLLGRLGDDELPFLWPIFTPARPHQSLHYDLRAHVLSIVVVVESHIENAYDMVFMVSCCFTNKPRKMGNRKGSVQLSARNYVHHEDVRWKHPCFFNNTVFRIPQFKSEILKRSRGDKTKFRKYLSVSKFVFT